MLKDSSPLLCSTGGFLLINAWLEPLLPPLTGEHLGHSTHLLKGGNSCPQGNALKSCHNINEELGEGAWKCDCLGQEAVVQGFGETPGSLGKNGGAQD